VVDNKKGSSGSIDQKANDNERALKEKMAKVEHKKQAATQAGTAATHAHADPIAKA